MLKTNTGRRHTDSAPGNDLNVEACACSGQQRHEQWSIWSERSVEFGRPGARGRQAASSTGGVHETSATAGACSITSPLLPGVTAFARQQSREQGTPERSGDGLPVGAEWRWQHAECETGDLAV
jgi:hypothetical protein